MAWNVDHSSFNSIPGMSSITKLELVGRLSLVIARPLFILPCEVRDTPLRQFVPKGTDHLVRVVRASAHAIAFDQMV